MISNFSEKIERLQAEQGISHSKLAQMTGMSRQTLYRVKKSKRPHMTTIHKLSKAFNVPVTFFLHE